MWVAIICACAWGVGVVLARLVIRATLRGDVETGLAMVCIRAYARFVHRLRVEGVEHVPQWRFGGPDAGPLIIVANHTAGVDPLLIQASVPFEISWLMLREMMVGVFPGLWEWTGVIPVAPGEGRSARDAIRRLESGGVIGIFPEGGIERPHGRIIPFEPGVGLIIHRSNAPVLQVVIDGTPDVASAFLSLVVPSRARVRFLPVKKYSGSGLGAAAIARDLQTRLERVTGWAVRTDTAASSMHGRSENAGETEVARQYG